MREASQHSLVCDKSMISQMSLCYIVHRSDFITFRKNSRFALACVVAPVSPEKKKIIKGKTKGVPYLFFAR